MQAQRIVGAFELVEIPARHFYDHVIQCRFKICGSGFGDLVFQFIQVITDGQLCGNLCDWITGAFEARAEDRLTRGIDLDGDQSLLLPDSSAN